MTFWSWLRCMWISAGHFVRLRKTETKAQHSLSYILVYSIYFVISAISGGKWGLSFEI